MAKHSHIEKILERQAKSWEVRRKMAGEGGEAAREALAHLQEGPWLTVSRQLGSGGLEIAGRVGNELGWEVYDKEILSTIAEHTHAREAILSRLDKGAITPFKDFVSHLIVPDDPGQLYFLQELTQVVWGLARQGQAVILGRGANWFLDPRYGLRLRLVASREARAKRLAAREGIGAAAADQQAAGHERDRREFVRKAFDRDIDDPLGYDLVLNTTDLDARTAGEIVLSALRRKLSSV